MSRTPRFGHVLEYALLRGAQGALRLLPRRVALILGAASGRILYHLRLRRHVVEVNLAHVGKWDGPTMRRIARRVYEQSGRYAVDFLRGGTRQPPVRIVNEEVVAELLSRGKGIIAIVAHFGNWELLARVFGPRLPELAVVGRRMKNPLFHRWLFHRRRGAQVQVINSNRAVRPCLRVLGRNGAVALLIDQYSGRNGNAIPFLGKPANTLRAVAGLHLHTGCALLPVYAIMQSDGTYEAVLRELPPPSVKGRSREEAVPAIQEAHNRAVSEWILKYPEHYFGWFHKRYKRKAPY